MPKMKTHKGLLKRFKLTGSGKLRRYRAGTSHLMSGKSAKRRRRLGKSTVLTGKMARKIAPELG